MPSSPKRLHVERVAPVLTAPASVPPPQILPSQITLVAMDGGRKKGASECTVLQDAAGDCGKKWSLLVSSLHLVNPLGKHRLEKFDWAAAPAHFKERHTENENDRNKVRSLKGMADLFPIFAITEVVGQVVIRQHPCYQAFMKLKAGPLRPLGQLGGSSFKSICPKYCAIDGGVFLEDGTRR
ncbi:hypothetical protein GPALN_005835 [Globodera pallida]|nr:hypothetical protein GPALN_005835 [Globodera pallida]